jgi:hypothetical protein
VQLLGLLEKGAGLGPHLMFRITHHANLNASIAATRGRAASTMD